jgi:hypothetical protein
MIPCSCSLQYTTVCDMRLPANHRWGCPERARLEAEQGKPQAIAVNRSQVEPLWGIDHKADPEVLRRLATQGEKDGGG